MRHAVLAILGVAILGVLLSADAAEADCGIPNWVGTPHDTYVPRTGTLYVHDESLTGLLLIRRADAAQQPQP